nr:nuclear receptor subfamily 4 group A member 1-like [Lytechinus pictus]
MAVELLANSSDEQLDMASPFINQLSIRLYSKQALPALLQFNPTYTTPEVKLAEVKSASDFNLAVFFELLFSLAESLHGMHLREEDIAVFSALLLLASDLQGLKQKMQVEALQDKVLSGFAYMLSQNHRCKPNLLPQVLMCMPTLRTISTSYLELTAVPRHTMVAPPPPDSTAMAMRLF